MTDSANSVDSTLDIIMGGLDLEKLLSQTLGINILMQRLAPQEMDRLIAVLNSGIRAGLLKASLNQNLDSGQQLKAIQDEVTRELNDAGTDMEIKDLENNLNIGDFVARVYRSLPEQINT